VVVVVFIKRLSLPIHQSVLVRTHGNLVIIASHISIYPSPPTDDPFLLPIAGMKLQAPEPPERLTLGAAMTSKLVPPLPPRPPLTLNTRESIAGNVEQGRRGRWIDDNWSREGTRPRLEHRGPPSDVQVKDAVLIADDVVVVAEDANVRAYDLKSGLSLWAMCPQDFLHPTTVLVQGHLLSSLSSLHSSSYSSSSSSSSRMIIMIGTQEGHVIFVDGKNSGRTMREHLGVHQRSPVLKLLCTSDTFHSADAVGRVVSYDANSLGITSRAGQRIEDPSRLQELIVHERAPMLVKDIHHLSSIGDVTCIYQAPAEDNDDEATIILGLADGTVIVCQGACKSTWRVSEHAIDCLLLSCHHGSSLWVCDGRGVVRVIDVASAKVLMHFCAQQRVHRLSQSGRQVLALSHAGERLELWDATLQDYHRLNDCLLDIPLDMSVRAVTWNVAGTRPPAGSPQFWRRLLGLHAPHRPAVIVVGLQEVIDLGSPSANLLVSAVSLGKDDQSAAQSWTFFLRDLVASHDYTLAGECTLVGLHLVVLLHPSIGDASYVHTASVSVNQWSTKGAVALRLCLWLRNPRERLDTLDSGVSPHGCLSLCFVNCHLPSGQENWREREEALERILRAVQFPALCRMDHAFVGSGTGQSIWDHHGAFLLGDLNSRLTEPDRLRVLEMTRRQQKSRDQLIQFLALADQADRRIMTRRFEECGDIAHFPAPTYKFDKHSVGTWDSSEKQRVPAFCDRILQRVHPAICRKVEEYTSVHESVPSDHKPVVGTMRLQASC
jgi:hypothetical protein